MTAKLTGLDALREWLSGQGFKAVRNHLRPEQTGCNWYAYRQSALPARQCECNECKAMQIVVRPFSFERQDESGGFWESAEVDVTGEAGGHWYKLQCYSLTPDELMANLPKIEAALISAWNALMPSGDSQADAKPGDLSQLPPCSAQFAPRWPGDEPGYTADEMRAYAAEQVAAEREKWGSIVSHAASELEELDEETAQREAKSLRLLLGNNSWSKTT